MKFVDTAEPATNNANVRISPSLPKHFCILPLVLFTISLPAQTPTASQSTAPQIADLDWSRHLVDSTLTRSPDPKSFGSWAYPRGLYLFGQYLTYRRTGEKRYLQYIEDWVDTHIDAEGHPDHEIHALDDVLAANLLVVLYEETHQPRYKLAADIFRHRFDSNLI